MVVGQDIMPDLSILIPARNEMFLARTVQDILLHIEGDTEIIVVLDGAPADPPLPVDERVRVIQLSQSIGQRAATNLAARASQAKYVMKCDAHCAFDQGFDVKMMRDMRPDWTMVPLMRNLHVFDWVCRECGHRRYQSPSGPCGKCGGETCRDVVWAAKTNPSTTAMLFDSDLKFGYWRAYKNRQRGDLVETMSCLGACWMIERERYHELGMLDEGHGSWGQMGTEVACKTWLSGGSLICNKRTWFAHMFRTQGGDFGFPYPLSSKDVKKARAYSHSLWMNDSWPHATRPLSWILNKFAPVPKWPAETKSARDKNSKGLVYYTDNRLDKLIMDAVQCQLRHCQNGYDLVSVSLQPVRLGRNFVVRGERGVLTMFRQQLAGIEAIDAEIVFLVEHDVLYHPSHFDFVPLRKDVFYYNNHVWRVDAETGRALFHYSNHVSQLCAYRELLLEHYRKRIKIVEEHGFSRRMGFEPGTHRREERVDDTTCGTWMSADPNIDLRHGRNLTQTRWRKDQFRNQRYTRGWKESDGVPGWGHTLGEMPAFLARIVEERNHTP